MPCDSDCRRNWRPDAKHCALATRAARSANRILVLGTLTPEELYLSNELDSLAASDHRFQYFPVVSQGGSAWSGRQGLVVNAAIEDCEDLSSADIYIASPTMVYGTLDRLVEEGVDADRVSADVFDYALDNSAFPLPRLSSEGHPAHGDNPTQQASRAELAPGYENLRSARR